jgi:hypothetical protein
VSIISKFEKVNTMNEIKRDIIIGLLFITGIWCFISGGYIMSTLMFASAAIYSNIAVRPKLEG